MAYQKQTWRDLPNTSTPITAARLNHMETQYEEAVSESGSYTDTRVDDAINQFDGEASPSWRVSLQTKRYSGHRYIVSTIHADGRPSPSMLRRYVDTSTSSPGSEFKPPQYFINEKSPELGATLIVNASGWNTGNGGEMRGAQFVDGELWHSLSTSDWKDAYSIGMKPDGFLEVYDANSGDTDQDLLDDHIIWSVSFGPVLIKGGAKAPIDHGFIGGRSTQKSSLCVLGQKENGDILIIAGPGVTNSWGTTFEEAADIALNEGCVTAMHLDQGGSTQLWAKGTAVIPSSDNGTQVIVTSEPGRRKLPDMLYTTVPVVTPAPAGEIPIKLESNMESNNALIPSVSVQEGAIFLTGSVKKKTGTISDANGEKLGEIPLWVSPSQGAVSTYAANGRRTGKLIVRNTGVIEAYPGEQDHSYVELDSARVENKWVTSQQQ